MQCPVLVQFQFHFPVNKLINCGGIKGFFWFLFLLNNQGVNIDWDCLCCFSWLCTVLGFLLWYFVLFYVNGGRKKKSKIEGISWCLPVVDLCLFAVKYKHFSWFQVDHVASLILQSWIFRVQGRHYALPWSRWEDGRVLIVNGILQWVLGEKMGECYFDKFVHVSSENQRMLGWWEPVAPPLPDKGLCSTPHGQSSCPEGIPLECGFGLAGLAYNRLGLLIGDVADVANIAAQTKWGVAHDDHMS